MTIIRERERPISPTTILGPADRVGGMSPMTPPAAQNKACFMCQKQGHWYKECPEKNRSTGGSLSPPSADAAISDDYPTHYCVCGRGVCVVSVSKTEKNPGRRFYRCPGTGFESCKYFQWCDQLKENQIQRTPPQSRYPNCQCGAGVCAVVIEPGGRRRFICPIKKGEGACDFVLRQDYIPSTAAGESSLVGRMEDNNADDIQREIDDSLLEVLSELEGVESNNNQSAVPSLEHDVISEEGFQSESAIEGSSMLDCTGNSKIRNGAELEKFQLVDPRMPNSAPEDTSSTGNAESPLREPVDQPVALPDKRLRLDSSGNKESWVPSSPQSLHELGSIMSGNISESFNQLAARLRGDLIKLLQSMAPSDHEKMRDEATTAFTALKGLQVDHEIFYARVMGFIEQAERVVLVNEAMGIDTSSEELMKRYYSEKSIFDKVSEAHCKEVGALAASRERLQSAKGNAAYLKDLLLKADREVASCEAETKDLQVSVAQVTERYAASKKRFENASRETAKVLKVSQRREIEVSAAEAAFETARAQLKRGCE